jgi:hypothetical protein
MFQTALLFLAPGPGTTIRGSTIRDEVARDAAGMPARADRAFTPMATRTQPASGHWWSPCATNLLAVAGNALGFILLMSGLGMVLRLAAILLS